MDITTLAAWGEFLGGIAVVVSLIYLAGQIRQSSRLMQVSTAVAAHESDAARVSLLMQDPEMMRLYFEGLADCTSLSEADRRRFDTFFDQNFRGFLANWRFAQAGILDEAVWEYDRNGQAWHLQQPGVQQWWNEFRFLYGDEFGAFVDGLIRKGEAAG